jgi:mannose-6-phosphate isomerase-like protein (cupin superfamily)
MNKNRICDSKNAFGGSKRIAQVVNIQNRGSVKSEAPVHNKNDPKFDSDPIQIAHGEQPKAGVRVAISADGGSVVTKPWGREIILTHCPHYTFKRIEIKKGFKTSLQYHCRKTETIIFVSGQARVVFEDSANRLVYQDLAPGSVFETSPPAIHQVIALSDISYFEASTPDPAGADVMRIRDSFGRKDGRIEHEHKRK